MKLVKDREAWHAAVLGVAESWTWLSNWTDFPCCSFWTPVITYVCGFFSNNGLIISLCFFLLYFNVFCSLVCFLEDLGLTMLLHFTFAVIFFNFQRVLFKQKSSCIIYTRFSHLRIFSPFYLMFSTLFLAFTFFQLLFFLIEFSCSLILNVFFKLMSLKVLAGIGIRHWKTDKQLNGWGLFTVGLTVIWLGCWRIFGNSDVGI